jgi:hypothetical protein
MTTFKILRLFIIKWNGARKDGFEGSRGLLEVFTAAVFLEKHETKLKIKVASNLTDIRIHDLSNAPLGLYCANQTLLALYCKMVQHHIIT